MISTDVTQSIVIMLILKSLNSKEKYQFPFFIIIIIIIIQ
jgi:hypothetical protein